MDHDAADRRRFHTNWLVRQLTESHIKARRPSMILHGPGWSYPHDPFIDYDIHYLFEGAIRYEFSDAVYQLGPGEMFFMPPGVRFHERDVDGGSGVRMLGCHFVMVHGSGTDPLSYLELPAKLVSSERQVSDVLARRVFAAGKALSSGDLWAGLAVAGRLIELLGHMLEHGIARGDLKFDVRRFAPDWLWDVLQIMDEQLSDPCLDVDRLSGYADLSPSHFAHQFTRYAGVPPKQLLLRRRMERACFLLASEPTLPIRQIAARCGFADPYHFSAQFKRHHRISPTHWRQAALGD